MTAPSPAGPTRATEAQPAGRLTLEAAEGSHTRSEWEAAAAKVLRKARQIGEQDPHSAVWEALTRPTLDGIGVPPLGHRELLEGLATTGRPSRSGAWDNRVTVSLGVDGATELLTTDLAGGATSVWVRAAGDVDPAALRELLAGVDLATTPVVVEARQDATGAAQALAALLHEAGTPASGTSFGADPVGALVAGIDSAADVAETVAAVAELARDTGVGALVVDATAVHDRGASEAQELGYSLAVAAAYLRILSEAGAGVAEAAGVIEFRYAATDEQFPTIAKLRAARRLWARMLELSGVSEAPAQRQHVVTSRPMMSRYDPYVNLLRTTVAAFAAGVGGADAVTVLPFDSALGEPDAFGRRIARNTNTLLIAEAHVAAVADPAGGAFAVEKLTDDLARAAWEELARIEETGGVVAAVADGSLLARVGATADRRDREVATRRRPLTGLSEFPDLNEVRPERAPAVVSDSVRSYGAAFEMLRDEPAGRPVFLATMGSVAAHTARATFATNLLAAGGVGVVQAGATTNVADVVAAYSGEPVVCLAGTDAAYGEWGADLVTALRGAGARRVVLAGKPGPRTVEDVDDSCALGVDALEFLSRTREVLA